MLQCECGSARGPGALSEVARMSFTINEALGIVLVEVLLLSSRTCPLIVDGCASSDSESDENLAGPSSSSSVSVQAADGAESVWEQWKVHLDIVYLYRAKQCLLLSLSRRLSFSPLR